MGVRGLTTYINFNQDAFLQNFYLYDSCLVIDGHSLCAQLYRQLNCFSAFGGDYDKFALYVRNFFKNLRKCNITTYVLFDGSYERRKLKTAHSRLRSKIYGASKLDPVTQGAIQIFPLLLRDAFTEALSDLNVPYTICEFEADDEIAALARYLNCPVLSYDSDFFIYNVLYIPFNTLDYKAKPVDINGNKTNVLECKIYRTEHMIRNFGGLKEEMLPLLATMLGNDFVEKRVFKKFFSEFKLPKTKKKTNEQQRCIHGLFKWLQDESLDTAIAKILGRVRKNKKNKVLYIIKKSIDGYNSKHCRSLKYFDISEDTTPESDWQLPEDFNVTISEETENEELANEDTKTSDSDNESQGSENEDNDIGDEDDVIDEDNEELILGLPDWFAEGIRQNHIPKAHINLYTHHLHFCSPQAEDYNDVDSFICALPIMRYAFDILTDYSHEYCIYVSREKNSCYQRIPVGQEYATTRQFDITFKDLTVEQLQSCFKHFMKEQMPLLNLNELEVLPSNFQLYFIAIIWWIAKCEAPIGNVHSLIMSYVMLEAVDEKTGTFRGHNHFNNKYGKKIEELKASESKNSYDEGELFLNKHKVQYEDSLIAAAVLLKHFELDDKIKKRPKSYDSKRMHSFAQFQCCLQQINCLNILCRRPYECTKYSKSFNGTFVYNVATKLENQDDPKLFFQQYLKGASTVLLFYKNLCGTYEKCMEQMGLKTVKWMKKKRGRRKNMADEEINFIVQGFESEPHVMLEAVDEKTGTFRGHNHFNNKYGKKIEELKGSESKNSYDEGELFLNKHKVQYEDSLIAAAVLLKHFELDDKIIKRPKSYDSKRMHSVAQFQCCLQQINCLNILCRRPYECTKYSKSYNSTFAYNVASKLENQDDPKLFSQQYLKGASAVLLFYKNLCSTYEKCMEQMGLKTVKWMKKKRGRRKNMADEEINFIVKGFESEVII